MRDEWIHLAKELAEIDKMWRLFKTVIWILIGIIVVALTMSCGTNHRVSGGTDHDATATVKLMKICDRTAIQVCNDDTMTIEDRTGISKANISRAWEELLRKDIVWLVGSTSVKKGKRAINNYAISGTILSEARLLTKKRGIGKVINLYEE